MTLVFREERFRTPLDMERSIGLWVDRIGRDRAERQRGTPFRIFGQFAALAIEEGVGTLEILGRPPLPLQPGDAFILFPHLPMRYRPARIWETHWVVWNGPESSLLAKIGCLSESHPILSGCSAVIQTAFKQLEPLMNRQDRPSLLQRKTIILDLIRLLDAAQTAHGPTPLQEVIRNAQRELERHASSPPAIDELARHGHMSPAYFRRLFKAHTGTTPKAFQMAQRITRAKEALANGASLKETAARLGFSDVFHFMRVFKKVTGQTAGRFASSYISDHIRGSSTAK